MERIKESMSAAAEALQQMYSDIERIENEMNETKEYTELFDSMKVETMLALLRDGSTDALHFARPHLIEFLENYLEEEYIKDEREGKLLSDMPTALWVFSKGNLICSECRHTVFNGKLTETCPYCGSLMTNTSLVAEQVIIEGIKNPLLCELCAYGEDCCHFGHECGSCDQNRRCCDNGSGYSCRCDSIKGGEHCPYFERRGEHRCQCQSCLCASVS